MSDTGGVSRGAAFDVDGGFAALVEVVRAGGVTVLSGAGLSTESGIPDYRGADGVRRVTPMTYQEFVGTSEARQRYWARGYLGWARFAGAGPNAGHRVVAQLQRRGLVGTVITQNVDGLHQAAGSGDVVELHGSLAQVVCLACGARRHRTDVQQQMARENPDFTRHVQRVAGDGSRVSSQIRPDGDIVLDDAVVTGFLAPQCLDCGSDALKPDVVFFGESVPRDRVSRCTGLVADSRALLVLGSSLAVMSGYRFVRQAARAGIPVGIVTLGPTRGDAQATVKVDAPLGATLLPLLDLVD